jgi:dCMP deaminase
MADWGLRFKELALHVASWSKDKSTKVGAIIVDDDRNPLAIGYNGFPRKCRDDVEERYERPLKYKWTEHAERNAIYTAARNGVRIEGATMYLFWFPCVDCARGIIQSGIREIYCDEPNFQDERWGEDFKISDQMFKEAGIIMNYYKKEE